MKDWLDTGPNDAIQKDVLDRLVNILKQRGCKICNWRRDDYGRYSAELEDVESGLPFCLVGRGSDIWKLENQEIVSIHKPLYEGWKGPIVLGLLPVGIQTPEFFIFDSELIAAYVLRENEYKPDCYLVNFPFWIVSKWENGESFQSAWERYKQKKERLLKQYITYFVR